MSYSVQRLQGADLSGMSDVRLLAICAVAGIMVLGGIAIAILVEAPLRVGLKYFMLKAADFEANLENLLYPFRNGYKNIVWVMFVKNLYITLWSLLGFIPIVVGVWKFGLWETLEKLIVAVQNESVTGMMSLMAISGGLFILTFIFMIPAYIKSLQYSQVEYILAENPELKRAEAIGRSKEMMVGNKWPFIKLIFSFTGWYILANTACCIGNFLLTPYIESTYAQMYLEISGQGKDYSGYDFRQTFNGFDNM